MKKSAGLVVYRLSEEKLQVLLIHPGGPFYAKKDTGVWSIPKGEYLENEDKLAVDIGEFQEETGHVISTNQFLELAPVKIKSGKTITSWAVMENFEPPYLTSNTFEMEWPPGSGIKKEFPEADKAAWFSIEEAKIKIHPGQLPILRQLEELLHENR